MALPKFPRVYCSAQVLSVDKSELNCAYLITKGRNIKLSRIENATSELSSLK